MELLNWYDWIQPTNPYASIFFGVIFTIIITFVVWLNSKEFKTTIISFLTGLSVTIIGVIFLKFIGYYG